MNVALLLLIIWPPVRVAVVAVTPDAVVVATECVTCGPPAPGALAPVLLAEVPAPPACAAVPAAGNAWWASAPAAAAVPTISAAPVQLDTRRTCRKLSRRVPARPARSGSLKSRSGTRPPRSPWSASMFVSLPRQCLHADACDSIVRER